MLPRTMLALAWMLSKKYITAPRLGNVEFGTTRKRKLVYIFGINLLTLLLALGAFFTFKWLPIDASQAELLAPLGLGFWIAGIHGPVFWGTR